MKVESKIVGIKETISIKGKICRIKKSEIAYLASLVKDVLDVHVAKDTAIEADLIIFDGNGNKDIIKRSLNVTEEDATYMDVMNILRHEFGSYIELMAARMNLVLRFGGIAVDSGLISSDDYVLTGKRDTRYKVFNSLFILCAASHEGMEIPKLKAKSIQKRPS